MRVALIGPLPPARGGATPGGVATHFAHLADGLARTSEVEACVLGTNVRARHASEPGIYVPRSSAEWLSPTYLRAVGASRALRFAASLSRQPAVGSRRATLGHLLAYARFLDAVRPDVVHVQHPLERLTYLRQLRRLEPRHKQTPIVVTAHSFLGEHPDALIHGVMAPNLTAAARVIAVSPHIADQAVELGVPRERVRVIRSGVDTERFAPRDTLQARSALRIADATKLVLFVGNLEPRKQLDVLLHAMRPVRASERNAQLAIVGSGESAGALDQTESLRRLSRELELDHVVRFVGRVGDADLMRWYAAADVFALPSASEAQGIVALEAMACGLPVVASAVGGLLGTVDDGVSGFLVPPREVEPLAARVIELLLDEPKRVALGAAARTRVVNDFSWPAAIGATVDVYREVLA